MENDLTPSLGKDDIQLLYVKGLASEVAYFLAMIKQGTRDMLNPDLSLAEREAAKIRHCFAIEELDAAIEGILMRLDDEVVIH